MILRSKYLSTLTKIPALMILRSKYLSTLEDAEGALYPAVSICSQGLILDAKIKTYVHLMQICFLSLINGNIYMFTKELF